MGREEFSFDDADIVRAVQRGETHQFEWLVTKYQPRLYRIAHYYLHDQEEARDMAQEAFLLAFKHINGFRGEAKFSTWVVRIVINLSLNRLRKPHYPSLWGKWKAASPDKNALAGDLAEVANQIPDPTLNPEQRVLTKELGRKIRQAVDTLPDKQKAVFILRHLEGLSIKEICEVTQMVEGTVKSYLSRAARRMQELMEKYYGK